jgi:hypothetical protein
MRRKTFIKKTIVSKTPYSKEDRYEAQYLMEPVRELKKPNCNTINCPVLTKKNFKNRDGSVDAVPYCGMYCKYLRKGEGEVIKPCGACLRERRSLWES